MRISPHNMLEIVYKRFVFFNSYSAAAFLLFQHMNPITRKKWLRHPSLLIPHALEKLPLPFLSQCLASQPDGRKRAKRHDGCICKPKFHRFPTSDAQTRQWRETLAGAPDWPAARRLKREPRDNNRQPISITSQSYRPKYVWWFGGWQYVTTRHQDFTTTPCSTRNMMDTGRAFSHDSYPSTWILPGKKRGISTRRTRNQNLSNAVSCDLNRANSPGPRPIVYTTTGTRGSGLRAGNRASF